MWHTIAQEVVIEESPREKKLSGTQVPNRMRYSQEAVNWLDRTEWQGNSFENFCTLAVRILNCDVSVLSVILCNEELSICCLQVKTSPHQWSMLSIGTQFPYPTIPQRTRHVNRMQKRGFINTAKIMAGHITIPATVYLFAVFCCVYDTDLKQHIMSEQSWTWVHIPQFSRWTLVRLKRCVVEQPPKTSG